MAAESRKELVPMKKTSMDTDGAVAAQDVDVRPPLHSTTDTTFIQETRWVTQYGK